MKVIHCSGKRKSAVARATLFESGSGKIRVNNQLLEAYNPPLARMKIFEASVLAGDVMNNVDVDINVNGGGVIAQAEAARLAMSKALAKHSKKLEKVFLAYDRNFLVADVRRNESCKPNCRGKARAKKQKSYR
jgi:small subunit ribosomal protein S9